MGREKRTVRLGVSENGDTLQELLFRDSRATVRLLVVLTRRRMASLAVSPLNQSMPARGSWVASVDKVTRSQEDYLPHTRDTPLINQTSEGYALASQHFQLSCEVL